MTALNKDSVRERLDSGSLFVSPRPPESAIGDGTIDLSVGSVFLCSTRSSVPTVDVARPEQGARLFTELRLRAGATFVLQPNQFALASTLEYVALPRDLAGLLQSRSTYGRMGLVSVAAAWVSSAYKGCPTLELYNAGDVALSVTPGTRICQLVLVDAQEAVGAASRYHCHTRPYFAQAAVDDWLRSLDEQLNAMRDAAGS